MLSPRLLVGCLALDLLSFMQAIANFCIKTSFGTASQCDSKPWFIALALAKHKVTKGTSKNGVVGEVGRTSTATVTTIC